MIFPPDTIQYLVVALAAASTILVVEVLYLQFVRGRNKGAVNRRLRLETQARCPISAQ